MNLDPQLVFFIVIFAAVMGYSIFRVTKHGGVKAAMFGASIGSTVGTVVGSGSKMIKTPITVYKLGSGDPEKAIGLEIVSKSLGSYQMLPISLSVAEAKNLIEMLETAVDGM